MSYFEIKPIVNHQNISFIGNLTEHFNPYRKFNGSPARRQNRMLYVQEGVRLHVDEKETEKNFIFAGLFYFLILVPQTLRKMFGIEVEYDFYHCTGWPLISAGLGGSLPPSQILKEASLYPCEVERNNFHRMLVEIVPFMNGELRNFFINADKEVLNDEAYERMMSQMGGNIDDFLLNIQEESIRFTDLFKVD